MFPFVVVVILCALYNLHFSPLFNHRCYITSSFSPRGLFLQLVFLNFNYSSIFLLSPQKTKPLFLYIAPQKNPL